MFKTFTVIYSLKVIHGNHEETLRQHIIREMEIMKKIDPYVVKCREIFEKGEEIHFVLEYRISGA